MDRNYGLKEVEERFANHETDIEDIYVLASETNWNVREFVLSKLDRIERDTANIGLMSLASMIMLITVLIIK